MRHIPWLRMDPRTGVPGGTPRAAGTYPVIVSCVVEAAGSSRRETRALADAVLVVVRVEP